MSYTPTASEPGTNITVVYEVCNTAVTPSICATATVNISVPAAVIKMVMEIQITQTHNQQMAVYGAQDRY